MVPRPCDSIRRFSGVAQLTLVVRQVPCLPGCSPWPRPACRRYAAALWASLLIVSLFGGLDTDVGPHASQSCV